MTGAARAGTVHRANYTLERGVWRATCRACNFTITDPVRQRATSLYRAHIRDMSEAAVTIDLRNEEIAAPTRHAVAG